MRLDTVGDAISGWHYHPQRQSLRNWIHRALSGTTVHETGAVTAVTGSQLASHGTLQSPYRRA